MFGAGSLQLQPARSAMSVQQGALPAVGPSKRRGLCEMSSSHGR